MPRLRRYVPGGTPGNANRPSRSVTAANGVSATKSHAVIHVWTSHFTRTMPGSVNVSVKVCPLIGIALLKISASPFTSSRGRCGGPGRSSGRHGDALRSRPARRASNAQPFWSSRNGPFGSSPPFAPSSQTKALPSPLPLPRTRAGDGRSALPQIATSEITGRGGELRDGAGKAHAPKTPSREDGTSARPLCGAGGRLGAFFAPMTG